MRKPKPPTPLRVSATLRTAAFRSARDRRDEGYKVSWHDSAGRSDGPVRVEFQAPDDGTSKGLLEASGLRDLAMTEMAKTLRRKGWQVIAMDRPAHLIVKGA